MNFSNWSMRNVSTLLKQLIPIVVLVGCGVFMWPHLKALDVDQLAQSWHRITWQQWGLAALFTVIGFYGIAQYDVIAHRQLNTGLAPARARRSGFIAIAIAQFVGFGVVTAMLARWRDLPGYGPKQAALVTGFVSILFLAALLAITAMFGLFMPTPSGMTSASSVVIALLTLAFCISLLSPRLQFRGRTLDLPSLRATGHAMFWALIDVIGAAAVIYVLIAPAEAPSFSAFLPVMILAVGIGLYSGTPGGAGPFELTLIGLTATGMPAQTDTSALLVAIAGYRIIYTALPGLLALGLLMLPRKAQEPAGTDQQQMPQIQQAPRAETGVARQNGALMEPLGRRSGAAFWCTGQAFVGLFDPIERLSAPVLKQIKRRAFGRNRYAMLYKISAVNAAIARQNKWHCLHIADDAIIRTAGYALKGSSMARLRRKLRKSEAAGTTIRPLAPDDLDQLARIDAAWQRRNGTARGGTMGRFCPSYLAHQTVFVAETDSVLSAFVSFHRSPTEWALDLVRFGAETPDGAMHALVHAGILEAQQRGIAKVSLSAVPACPKPESAAWRKAAELAVRYSGGTGLRQFKSSFAPDWKPLYATAPSRFALAVGLLDVTREVFFPAPLDKTIGETSNSTHEVDEFYEVVSKPAA